MGISDLFNLSGRVVAKVDADTRGAVVGIDKLQKKQRGQSEAMVKGVRRQDSAVVSHMDKLGGLILKIGLVAGAWKGVEAAVERFAKTAQLEGAAVGLNIDRIQQAAGGLITRFEALSLAAAAANTDFEVTQADMEQIAKFMVVLRNQGNDFVQVQNAVTRSVVEGNVRALRPFGVILEGSTGKLQTFQSVMQRFREENEKAGDSLMRSGDEAIVAKVKWKDTLEELVLQLGRIATALAPLVGYVADIVNGVTGLLGIGRFDAGGGERISIGDFYRREERITANTEAWRFGAVGRIGQRGRTLQMWAQGRVGANEAAALRPEFIRGATAFAQRFGQFADPIGQRMGRAFASELELFTVERRRARRRGGMDEGPGPSFLGENWQRYLAFRQFADAQIPQVTQLPPGAIPTAGQIPVGTMGQFASAALGQATTGAQAARPGPFDRFADAATNVRTLTTALMDLEPAAAQAFQTLTVAGGEALASLIDGTELAQGGFTRMVGSVLHALSAEMFAKSIAAFAEAAFQLARGLAGNPAGFAAAGKMAQAGAAYAGAGVAIGGMSRAFGGGGGASGGAGAGAGSASPGVAEGPTRFPDTGTSTTQIILTNVGDDPMRARRAIINAWDNSNAQRRQSRAVRRG